MCCVPSAYQMLFAEATAKQKPGPKSRKRKAKEEDDADALPTVSSTINKQKPAPYKLPEVHLVAAPHHKVHDCHDCANTCAATCY